MDDKPQRSSGWSSALDEWIEVLHPELLAEAKVSDADWKFARWLRRVAGAAAVELLRREPQGRAGRSSLVR
jgi:hypothetical protein